MFITLLIRKARAFHVGGGVQTFSPSADPQRVPVEVADDPMFAWSIEDGSIVQVEIKSPAPVAVEGVPIEAQAYPAPQDSSAKPTRKSK